MSRSLKLGLASLGVLALAMVPFILGSNTPTGLALAAISCVLASLAADQGSKWWLTVPVVVLLAASILLWAGFTASPLKN